MFNRDIIRVNETAENFIMMISADRTAEYGFVVEVMALLRSAGYTQVGLRTDTTKIKELTSQ